MPARRTRAVVDYRALDGADSDDDFNVATPPTKRPRVRKPSDRAAELADGAGPSHGRLSMDDKLFTKQLQIALEKSKTECKASDTSSLEHGVESADTMTADEEELIKISKREDISSQDSADQAAWSPGGASPSHESESSDAAESDDEFVPSPKKKAKKPPAAKKAATPKAKPVDQNRRPPTKRSFIPECPPPISSPPELKTASPVRSSPLASLPGAGPPVLKRSVLKSVNSPSTGSTARKVEEKTAKSPGNSLTLPASLPARSAPKWKPPARVSGGGSSDGRLVSSPMSSPGSGGLRLGLSRNIRRKPLHPSVKPIM